MDGPKRGRKRLPGPLEGTDSVVARALTRLDLRELAIGLRIDNAWPHAVGPAIAKNAKPHSFRAGVLTLATRHASWQHELHYLREPLLQKINAALPRPWVKELRFLTRARAPEAPAPTAHRAAEPTAREHAAAQAAADQITDETVRQTFARVMARALAQKSAATKKSDSPN